MSARTLGPMSSTNASTRLGRGSPKRAPRPGYSTAATSIVPGSDALIGWKERAVPPAKEKQTRRTGASGRGWYRAMVGDEPALGVIMADATRAALPLRTARLYAAARRRAALFTLSSPAHGLPHDPSASTPRDARA